MVMIYVEYLLNTDRHSYTFCYTHSKNELHHLTSLWPLWLYNDHFNELLVFHHMHESTTEVSFGCGYLGLLFFPSLLSRFIFIQNCKTVHQWISFVGWFLLRPFFWEAFFFFFFLRTWSRHPTLPSWGKLLSLGWGKGNFNAGLET